jgi:hypothetical protein
VQNAGAILCLQGSVDAPLAAPSNPVRTASASPCAQSVQTAVVESCPPLGTEFVQRLTPAAEGLPLVTACCGAQYHTRTTVAHTIECQRGYALMWGDVGHLESTKLQRFAGSLPAPLGR